MNGEKKEQQEQVDVSGLFDTLKTKTKKKQQNWSNDKYENVAKHSCHSLC